MRGLRAPAWLHAVAALVVFTAAGLHARQPAADAPPSASQSGQSASSPSQSSQASGQAPPSKPSEKTSQKPGQPPPPGKALVAAPAEPKPAQPILEIVPDSGKPDAVPLIQKGEADLDRKDYKGALDSLTAATRLAPDSVPAWFDLAYAYSGLHQNDQARRAYEKAVAINPNLFEARFNLGVLLVDMQQFQAAVPHLQEAAKLRPADARPHLYLGRALAGAGQPAAALSEFRRALQLDPKQAPAAYEIGEIEYNQKQFAAAALDFEKALGINPQLAQAVLGVASTQEAEGNFAEAEQGFKQYLQLRPADAAARYHLARLYIQQNQAEPALAELQQLEQSHAALPGLDAALGDAYALAGKFSQSEVYYRKALAASSAGRSSSELHRALAESLLKEGKNAEAEREFRQALQPDANDTDALKGLASSLYLQKRYADAAPIIEHLVQTPSAPAGLYFILATCYDHLHAVPQAVEAYRKFLARSHGVSPDQEWQARQRERLLSRELGKPL